MVYTILISIVFIAELIIATTVIQYFLKLDKLVLSYNSQIIKLNTEIKQISVLVRKISEQIIVLTQDYIDKTKRNSEDALLRQLSKLFLSLFLMKINIKFINRIRKSKITKTLAKGLSFIENMV